MSTLVTGVLAVGAAYKVGRSQLELQRRQISIQELTLKHELFDRRYSVYDRTAKFLSAIVRDGDRPAIEVMNNFVQAIGESRFLFDVGVKNGLREIWEQATSFFALKSKMDANFKSNQDYGEGNPEKDMQFMLWFSDRLTNLPDLFHAIRLRHE
ncbi:MAG TPA: hypothetical protein VGE65_07060 [Sphingobium sp.]